MRRIICAVGIVLFVITVIISIGCGAALRTTAAVSGDYTYTVSDNEAKILDYSGQGGEVIIPSVLGGCPVTSIGPFAFNSCSGLTGIVVSETVRTIGAGAFYDCKNLKSIDMGKSVTAIEDGAFDSCVSLEEITFGESVKSIGKNAFFQCTGLKNVKIGQNVETVGDNAFLDCTGLAKVDIDDIAAWCSVDFANKYSNPLIYADGFYMAGEAIKELNIPKGVEIIDDYAFFGYSGFTSIAVEKDNPNYHSDKNCLIDTEAKRLIIGCDNSLIPSDGSVKSIGNGAFYFRSRLRKVSIPETVTDIGDYAFYGCDKLTGITIPDSVIDIGDYSFYGCSGLTKVVIGSGVKTIGEYAFDACNNFTEIHVKDIAAWCSIDFGDYNCNPLYFANEFYVNGVLSTGLIIPDNVTRIGSEAFYGCDSINEVIIPDGVTEIGESAFSDCTKLTNVVIGSGVTKITDQFSGCKRIRYLTITKNLINIDETSFESCFIETICFIGKRSEWNSMIYADDSQFSGAEIVFKCFTHEYDNACDEDCNECGEKRSVVHLFEWVVDVEATCVSDGIKHEECTVCRLVQNEDTVINATNEHTYDNDCDMTCNVCENERMIVHTYGDDLICDVCGYERPPMVLGDCNDDGSVTDEDAVYLLFYTYYPDDYPVYQECDYNGDGILDDADAVHLLFYTYFPNDYPLCTMETM